MVKLSCLLLVILLISSSKSSKVCPETCQCDGSNWSCTGLDLSRLWSELSISSGVRSLTLRQSFVDLEKDLTILFPGLRELDISEGCDIRCPLSSTWLLDWDGSLVSSSNRGPEFLTCMGPKDQIQLSKILSVMREVRPQCPKACSWHLEKFHRSKNEDHHIMINVNCSSRGLKRFPKVLPAEYTIYLDLSHNQIEDVGPLAHQQIYTNVRYLDLSHNRISSISSLENSDWLAEFSLLNLQHNLLQEIPARVMTNMFLMLNNNRPYNRYGARLYLSGNPWRCDCLTINHFQNFIAKHYDVVKDVGNVTCGPATDSFGSGRVSGTKVVAVELTSVCADPGDGSGIRMLDILNVILALFALLVVLNLGYDCYIYRKTSKLPWLATKLPF